MAIYYGRNRRNQYTLDQRLGGGGEGDVYSIQGKSDLVAKIYNTRKFSGQNAAMRQEMQEKIETMLDQPVNPYINGVLSVAWPQDILFDQSGEFVGFTMPRVSSKYHIFAASRERERVILYPKYTWKTAVMIAYNLALAVSVVHATGAVVGDMNPNNIMLDDKGHVTLIDTDSFNITNKRTGKVYKCKVGVAEMLPAELQGKNLADPKSQFTQATDNFALAIHVFNLLMNNCHPFGCTDLSKSKASKSSNPVVSNITKGYCPYVTGGTGSTSTSAPDVAMLPKDIRGLFDRAFSYDTKTSVKQATISNRPSADEWKIALRDLFYQKMATCSHDASHVYPSHYSKCPWCAVKNGLKPNPTPNPVKPIPTPNSNNQTKYQSFGAKRIRRNAWPLWISCIAAGIISGPAMAGFATPLIYEFIGLDMEVTVVAVILAIIGGICGAVIAGMGEESYQTAYNGWPWLLIAVGVPLASMLAVGALLLAIGLVVLVVTAVLYIIGLVLGAVILFSVCCNS